MAKYIREVYKKKEITADRSTACILPVDRFQPESKTVDRSYFRLSTGLALCAKMQNLAKILKTSRMNILYIMLLLQKYTVLQELYMKAK